MKKLKNIIALSTFIFLLAFSAKVSFALDDEVVDSSTNDVTTQLMKTLILSMFKKMKMQVLLLKKMIIT